MHVKRGNLFAVAALAMASLCAEAANDYKYEPSREKVELLSLQEARSIVESIGRMHAEPTTCYFYFLNQIGNVKISNVQATRFRFGRTFFEVTEGNVDDSSSRNQTPLRSPLRYSYRDFPPMNLTYEAHLTRFDVARFGLSARKDANGNGDILSCWVYQRSPLLDQGAKRVADALRRLQIESERANSPQAAAAFERTAQGYRDLQVKPQLPEEARKFKAQAEFAIQQMRFDDAVDLYDKALGVVPWWPEGHFNLSAILAELNDFEGAIMEMQRYLKLMPDAPDARAVQLKIYQWESLVPRAAK